MIKKEAFCNVCGRYLPDETQGIAIFRFIDITGICRPMERTWEKTTEGDLHLCWPCLRGIVQIGIQKEEM